MITQDWKIKARSHVCHESGRHFEDGENFYTALFEITDDEDEDDAHFERRDYSAEAWETRPEDQPSPFSFWRSVYEAPEPAATTEVVEKESAESLLRRLIEEDDATTENARFILAVMLERKKILVETDVKDAEGESCLRFYEHAKSGEVFIIRDPQLRLDEVEAVQAEVVAQLGGESAAKDSDSGSGQQPDDTNDEERMNE